MEDFDPESAGVAPTAFDPESAGHAIGPVAVQPAPHEDPAAVARWNAMNPIQKLMAVAPDAAKAFVALQANSGKAALQMGKSVALNGGLPAAGQALGAMTGPLAPVAVPVLGALGAATGNAIDQFTRPGDQPFKYGEFWANTGLGAIPGSSLAKTGVKQVALAGFKYGAANVAAKTIQTGIDENRMPTLGEAAIAGGLGAITAPIAAVLSPGSNVAAAEAKKALYAVRDGTLKDARAAGYSIPASKVNPSAMNNMAESIGGKAAIGQEAALKNQLVTNDLAKKAIGIPADQPITPQAIADVRESAGQAYENVAALNPQAASDLAALKQARFDKNLQYSFFQRSGNPDALAKAQASGTLADSLEAKLEAAATAAKQPQLVTALKDARKTIAKTYVVENALNAADGNVSAAAIGRQFYKGKPLTDELATIGRFQQAFPAFARDAASTPAAGVSKLKAFEAATGATAGYHFAGPAGAVVGGAAAFAPDATRSALLSKFFQNSRFAQPAYNAARPDIQELLARFAGQAAGQQYGAPSQFLSPQAAQP